MVAIDGSDYIRNIFVENSEHQPGKYTICLFSNGIKKYIEIDDYFPCETSIVLNNNYPLIYRKSQFVAKQLLILIIRGK